MVICKTNKVFRLCSFFTGTDTLFGTVSLEKGISISKIAKKIKVARGTLYRYLAYTGIRLPSKTSNGRWERGIY
jgi:DNA invertase Pin-like site-specific DNA recombinase